MTNNKIVVEAMPDEFVLSHAHRRQIMTGARNYKEHYNNLLTTFGERYPKIRKISFLHLIAASVDTDPQLYARQHSMLPLMRVAGEFLAEVRVEGQWLSQAFHHGNSLLSNEVRICPACTDRDWSTEHFTWFKRSAQMVGVDICVEDGTRLLQIDDPDPFKRLPHQWLRAGAVSPIRRPSDRGQDARWYQRYVEITLGLLKRQEPVPCRTLNERLSQESSSAGFRNTPWRDGPLLSEVLVALAGNPWANHHIQSVRRQPLGAWNPAIDGIGMTLDFARPGYLYAMILATLYACVPSALAVVAECDWTLLEETAQLAKAA